MLETRYFNIRDFEELNAWRVKRGLEVVKFEELPESGLVVFKEEGESNIAMGFLRKAEDLGILDSMVTNPESSSADRDFALDILFVKLMDMAIFHGFTWVMGTTNNENMIKRSEKFNFKKSDHVLMARRI